MSVNHLSSNPQTNFLSFLFSVNLFHPYLFSSFLYYYYFSTSLLEYNCFTIVSFCFITKRISYTYTYIPISPPSCVSLPPYLSHPSRWSQSTELISLCYAAASHQLAILHLVVQICPCHSLISSQLTLPPPRVLKFMSVL